jgi:hypothetical protein
MKPTEQHVTNKRLDWMIGGVELNAWKMAEYCQKSFIDALLELKQRRAIDRQRENDGK